MASALRAAEGRLPVTSVLVRDGRRLAVHEVPCADAKHLLLLIHGSCASLVQWEALLRHVKSSRLYANCRMIAFDAYGCGRSPKPREWHAYACSEHEADVAALLDMFTPRGGSALVIGHSMGASFALGAASKLSVDRGVRIDGLCLLGAFAKAPAAASHPIFLLPPRVLTCVQPVLDSAFINAALHSETRSARSSEHAEIVQICKEISRQNPMHMCKAYYRQLQVPSDEALRSVAQPVLLLCGEADGVVPLSQAQELSVALSNATMRVVPKSSHQLMQERPNEVHAAIDEFLAPMLAQSVG